MKIEELLTILDREALQVYTFNRDEIARVFRVPTHMLGAPVFYQPSLYASLQESVSRALAAMLDKDLRRIAKPKGRKKRARK